MPRIKKIKIHNYETARVVADMLVENTGTHMLDSGGGSGRMWQRNQATVAKHGNGPIATFEDMPHSSFGWPCVHPHENHRQEGWEAGGQTSAELWVSHHIYHWLKEAVEYNAEADKMLDKFADLCDADPMGMLGADTFDMGFSSRPTWFAIYRAFPDYYAKQMAIRDAEEERATRIAGGYSPEEIAEVKWENYYEAPTGPWDSAAQPEGFEVYTYNHENCLSQDIHFTYFEHPSLDGGWGDDGIALIMIHNGADARGGFTRPRAFTASTDSGNGPSLFDYDRFSIGCTECSAIWDNNGGEWNGADYDSNKVLGLSEYNAMEGTAADAANKNATTGTLAEDEKPWIVIDQGEAQYPSDPGVKVYCPHCGVGTLTPWFN